MMHVRLFRAGFAVFVALLGATPMVSFAQVWSTGTNGQMGYHGTPNPVSPNCVAPQVWTWTNGHYSCQNPPPPPPPSCPTGYTQTAAPSWNGSSWVGLGCAAPPPAGGIPSGTPESQVCLGALATIDPWGTPDSGFFHWSSDLAAGQSLYGSLAGPTGGPGGDSFNAWWNSLPWQNIAQVQQQYGTGAPAGNADMWTGYDGYGGYAACWVAPGTTNVLGTYYMLPTYEASGA